MVVYNSYCLFGRHLNIRYLFLAGLGHLNYRLVLTHSYAACLLHGNALYVSFGNLIDKRIENGSCSGGDAAGRHADEYATHIMTVWGYGYRWEE